VSVTSRHTIRINTDRIAELLGEDADLAAAQKIVRNSLSANSLATLSEAKAYAEKAGSRRAAP